MEVHILKGLDTSENSETSRERKANRGLPERQLYWITERSIN
jgi:hypothetical protein